MQFKNYHVTAELAGKTLAQALKQVLAGKSWNEVKRLIATRHVQVNGNLCLDEGRKLTTKDVVKVWEHPLARPGEERDVRIVYADEHLVVVEKPAGMTTLRHSEERHWPARRKQLQPTLDEVLPRVLARHLGWGHTNPKRERGTSRRQPRGRAARPPAPRLPRVRAVHRLDRDTSGLMVFARTPQAEQALVKLFAKHQIERAYTAVVHGAPAEQTIETWLVRDRGDGLRGSAPASGGGEAPGSADRGQEPQRAVTHVKPLETIGPYSIIECRLETGRTHQIRIHLSEIGHMLCGEKTYTHPLGGRPQKDDSGAPRHALHASELGLVHPVTGKRLSFRSHWPKDLASWLARLRNRVQGESSDARKG